MVQYYTRCIVLRGCFAGPVASFGRLSDQLKDTEIGHSSPAKSRVTGPHPGGDFLEARVPCNAREELIS